MVRNVPKSPGGTARKEPMYNSNLSDLDNLLDDLNYAKVALPHPHCPPTHQCHTSAKAGKSRQLRINNRLIVILIVRLTVRTTAHP